MGHIFFLSTFAFVFFVWLWIVSWDVLHSILNSKHFLFFQQGGYFRKLSLDSEILHGLLTHKNKRIQTQKKIRNTPFPPHYELKRGVFSKVVLGFRNFGYDFLGVWGDVWRWLCSYMQVAKTPEQKKCVGVAFSKTLFFSLQFLNPCHLLLQQ